MRSGSSSAAPHGSGRGQANSGGGSSGRGRAEGILESIASAVGALREQAESVGGAIREDLGVLGGLSEGAREGAEGAEAAAARADAHVAKGCWTFCRSIGAIAVSAGLFIVAYGTIRLLPKAPGWI